MYAMDYDQPPKADTRNARHAANDTPKEARVLVQTQMVKNQRENVENEGLKVLIFKLPVETQAPVQEILDQVKRWLEECPAFPPELLVVVVVACHSLS